MTALNKGTTLLTAKMGPIIRYILETMGYGMLVTITH